jgi:hypothetical protein
VIGDVFGCALFVGINCYMWFVCRERGRGVTMSGRNAFCLCWRLRGNGEADLSAIIEVAENLCFFPVSPQGQGSLCAGLSRDSLKEMVGWALPTPPN